MSDPTLNPQRLIALARQQTGLHDFDELPLAEPLEVMTRALLEEADLHAAGRRAWQLRLLNFLMTRLRAQDWFARHPEILEEKIEAPLIMLGLARTGSTLLQRLIASDDRFYYAAWWENRFPVPAPDDVAGHRRIAAAKAEVAAMLAASPELASIHPLDAVAADEDILLIDQTLMSTTPEAMACMPSYHAWIARQDLRPAYGYWKKLLQLLQWQKRRRGVPAAGRWLLKSPMHLGYVDVIAELFPDARFVQTHRDPLHTVPSFASLIHSLWSGVSASADPIEAGRQTCATLHRNLDRCLDARERLPAAAFCDVDYGETVADPIGAVARIYAHLGLPMTPSARAGIEACMAANPRERRPPHRYSPARFGFTEAGLKQRFQRYRESFIEPATGAPRA
jgi:hypothetical protein